VPEGAGLIIRTAGAQRTKTEIKRDYEYLQRAVGADPRTDAEVDRAGLIYEEGDLIKRSIRDLYSRDIDEILVEGERGYREAKDYMKMLMPSHAKNVKHYVEALPLFSRYPGRGLPRGDVQPGRAAEVGRLHRHRRDRGAGRHRRELGAGDREASIEETALKTNLEAAEEIARQMRLRDLAGLIVIDFIDMDERKNNAAVEKRLKEKLKSDRARIQVGRISAFGLLEMSRQRLRPGMIEATTKACPHCHGTGRTRSDDSMALALLRELEEEGVRAALEGGADRRAGRDRQLPDEPEARAHRADRGRFGMSVRVEGDPFLISPDFFISASDHRRTSSRPKTMPTRPRRAPPSRPTAMAMARVRATEPVRPTATGRGGSAAAGVAAGAAATEKAGARIVRSTPQMPRRMTPRASPPRVATGPRTRRRPLRSPPRRPHPPSAPAAAAARGPARTRRPRTWSPRRQPR
jgi:ribonuclease E